MKKSQEERVVASEVASRVRNTQRLRTQLPDASRAVCCLRSKQWTFGTGLVPPIRPFDRMGFVPYVTTIHNWD
ncbi:hypothetical protein PIB30_035805 [Stylosanthes scabra]|uniref:Uncharacterized protein n=1 Tax=Stylosanthes scabra TaxID=79078 RepID=A0ABU6WG52_9FABA|nr:hypothetical protein [Stylosanthes scabra]